jgi:hypothetical protein
VVTLAYIWLTFVYVTLTAAFAQAYEKNRIRFSVDPLVVVLLCAAGSQALSGVKLKRR